MNRRERRLLKEQIRLVLEKERVIDKLKGGLDVAREKFSGGWEDYTPEKTSKEAKREYEERFREASALFFNEENLIRTIKRENPHYRVEILDSKNPSRGIAYKVTLNGKRHRDDGPAVVDLDGTRGWYQNGEPHRDDGPAIIWASGSKFWYQNGKWHREDGPAIITADGRKEWYWKNRLVGKSESGFTQEDFEEWKEKRL